MNHIYRSIWSESLATWVAVPENTAGKGKRSAVKKAVIATGLAAFSSAGFALPTGGQVVAGQVNVSTPNATQMNIHQGSQNAIVNWNGFSIAAPETVNIQQPNASAVLLNRVVGVDASLIQGHLNANGQVYLVNPNGVLFSNTAQVDVGGLVASTNNISNADFMSGNYHFSQDGAMGAVSNQGRISVPTGGTVALIGTQVSNSGTIETPQGSTILAAGKTVDLDFKGNGLVEVKIPEAALNAQVANSGAILADAGRVVLTAKAANQLAGTVINQTGLIQAHSLTSRKGEILLDGGANGTVQAGGTLDASGQNANGGTINVFAGMQNGTVNVAGKLDASAPNVGNGGFIETSAAHVKVADSAKVSTLAANGKTGNWLIDPPSLSFVIAASGGDMTGAAVGSALATNNFTIQSSLGTSAGSGNGNIDVNDTVNWSANTTLTLKAANIININAPITATGASAGVSLFAAPAQIQAPIADYRLNGGNINLPGANATFSVNGTNYALIHNVNQLQAIPGQGFYALGNNIDGTGTNFTSIPYLFGNFDGLGHTITGLNITPNQSQSFYGTGLFGALSMGVIQNVGLVGGSVTNNGSSAVGALVGGNNGIIRHSYATSNVINDLSSSTSQQFLSTFTGGLVGINGGQIIDSYATGSVTTLLPSVLPQSVFVTTGGLVGGNNYGRISNTYAAGKVTSPNITPSMNMKSSVVGGLAGFNYSCCSSSISSSFWDIEATGQTKGVGTSWMTLNSTNVAGKTTAQMMQASTFSNAGWSIGDNTKVWQIQEGTTSPYFYGFNPTQQVTTEPDLDDQISALQNSGTKNRFLKEHDHADHEHDDNDENQKVDVDGQGQLLPTGVKGIKPARHENDRRLDMRLLRWLSFLGIHVKP